MSDFDVRQSDLERRRQFIESLRAQALSGQDTGQMVGRVYVPNIGGSVARLVNAWMARTGGEKLKQEESALAKERRESLNQELMNFEQNPNDPAVMRAALISAHPQMQELGKILLSRKITPEKKGEEWAVMSMDEKKALGLPLEDAYQKEVNSGKVAKLDNATKVVTTVNNSPHNEGAKDLAKRLNEEFVAARDAASDAQAVSSIMDQLEEYDRAGVFSGPTSNLAIGLTSLADTLGIPLPEETKVQLTNSEAARQQVTQQIANVLLDSSVGRSLTDPDRKQLEASFPSLMQTPEGRRLVIAKFREASAAKLQHYEEILPVFKQQYQELAPLLDAPIRKKEKVVPAAGQNRTQSGAIIKKW